MSVEELLIEKKEQLIREIEIIDYKLSEIEDIKHELNSEEDFWIFLSPILNNLMDKKIKKILEKPKLTKASKKAQIIKMLSKEKDID